MNNKLRYLEERLDQMVVDFAEVTAVVTELRQEEEAKSTSALGSTLRLAGGTTSGLSESQGDRNQIGTLGQKTLEFSHFAPSYRLSDVFDQSVPGNW